MSLFKSYQFYTKEEIECKAHETLMRMQADGFPPRWPCEANWVADALELQVDWAEIPPDNGGLIVAKIEPLKRLIILNENLPNLRENRGFEQSTIAHEIGHWILHINQDEADGLVQQGELNLSFEVAKKNFLCRQVGDQVTQKIIKTQLDSIEWQAQYFASCLLMPRYILEEKIKGRDLTKWSHLYAMKDELGVTISNLANRLQDIGWIYIPKGSKQIYKGNTPPNDQKRLF